MIKNLNNKFVISSTFFFSAFANAIIYTQLLTFLIDQEFSSYQRGLILAFGAILGFLLQFFVGYLIDKTQKIKAVMIFSQVLLQVFVFLTYNEVGLSVFFFGVTIAFMTGLHRLVQQLVESWIFQLNGNYGLYRSFASIGWSIGATILAYFIASFGYSGISWSILFLNVIIIFLFLVLKEPDYIKRNSKLRINDILKLISNKNYVYLLITYFWLTLIMSIEGISVIELMIQNNIPKSIIGYKFAITALVEVPFFIIGAKILAKVKFKPALMFVIAIQGLRFVFYSRSQIGFEFLMIAVIGGAIYPLINMLQRSLSRKFAPIELQMSAQMVMTSVISNFPIIVTPLLASYLSQIFTLENVILLTGILCIIPFITATLLEKQS